MKNRLVVGFPGVSDGSIALPLLLPLPLAVIAVSRGDEIAVPFHGARTCQSAMSMRHSIRQSVGSARYYAQASQLWSRPNSKV